MNNFSFNANPYIKIILRISTIANIIIRILTICTTKILFLCIILDKSKTQSKNKKDGKLVIS